MKERGCGDHLADVLRRQGHRPIAKAETATLDGRARRPPGPRSWDLSDALEDAITVQIAFGTKRCVPVEIRMERLALQHGLGGWLDEPARFAELPHS